MSVTEVVDDFMRRWDDAVTAVVDDLMLIFTSCVGSNMDDENKGFTFASTFDLREVSTIWVGQYHVIVVGVLLD